MRICAFAFFVLSVFVACGSRSTEPRPSSFEHERRDALAAQDDLATPAGEAAHRQPANTRAHTERVLATFRADSATIDLVGIEVPSAVERQAEFAMTLYWRIRTPFPESPAPPWRVFVHFDGEGERIQADHDVAAGGKWWLSDDVVEDSFSVSVDHPPGRYDIFVGWLKGKFGDWTIAEVTKPDATLHNRFRAGSIELH